MAKWSDCSDGAAPYQAGRRRARGPRRATRLLRIGARRDRKTERSTGQTPERCRLRCDGGEHAAFRARRLAWQAILTDGGDADRRPAFARRQSAVGWAVAG